MNIKRLLIPGIAILLLIAIGAWWYSPTQVVKRRVTKLLDTLTLTAGSGGGSRQMGAYTLNSLLAAKVELDTPTIEEANGSFDRAELESGFSYLATSARRTEFKLEEMKSVSVNGDHATVKILLDGLVELPGGAPVDGLFDVTFDWHREEDGWRLTRAVWRDAP